MSATVCNVLFFKVDIALSCLNPFQSVLSTFHLHEKSVEASVLVQESHKLRNVMFNGSCFVLKLERVFLCSQIDNDLGNELSMIDY